ncbi:prenylcysteine oxidase [Rhodotorula toruloides]|uniref:Prenylcysteine oxidase n=1 Tax=Rhodotorula toruloides TaxID=5286 RepID=A0A511KFJ8_RHOTO|nr:prenylcysteine oxidase [Rhodotorula toruloides]
MLLSLHVLLGILISSATSQLLFPVNNAQIPFEAPLRDCEGKAGRRWTEARPPRVAILGAGAGGSSAAYFLRHFGDLKGAGLDTEVTIYESAEFVGGRSTVIWPWNDDDPFTPPQNSSDLPVELGASIFVSANKNLQKARKTFALNEDAYVGEEGGMAMWDGERFVLQEEKLGWSWWQKAKLIWRYGRSPFTVRSLVQKAVADFAALYSPDLVSRGAFTALSNFTAITGLQEPASLHADEFFSKQGVADLFTNEIISAATQVNYGTPINRLHGVGALVSLAATGAVSVRGGNRQIFENFVGQSGARLRLGDNARVQSILKLDPPRGGRAQWVVRTSSGVGSGTYDAVILAAPFHQTGIQMVNSLAPSRIPKQTYVPLYVSFVMTNASAPQAAYFGFPDNTVMPVEIFGTFTTSSSSKPTFNSLNYLRALSPETSARLGEGIFHVVKMFSDHPLEADMLDHLFGKGNVAKTVVKRWLAYPKLEPVTKEGDFAPVRPDEGLYYPNSFERLISTMETAASHPRSSCTRSLSCLC